MMADMEHTFPARVMLGKTGAWPVWNWMRWTGISKLRLFNARLPAPMHGATGETGTSRTGRCKVSKKLQNWHQHLPAPVGGGMANHTNPSSSAATRTMSYWSLYFLAKVGLHYSEKIALQWGGTCCWLPGWFGHCNLWRRRARLAVALPAAVVLYYRESFCPRPNASSVAMGALMRFSPSTGWNCCNG